MGDSDGSSMAAQSAQSIGQKKSIFSRILSSFGGRHTEPTQASSQSGKPAEPVKPTHGLMNLRRLRVEDVAIPKIEIAAIPDTATIEEISEAFRTSEMTRLPVYSGTLDTPLGMAHLKDFALKYGFVGEHKEFDLLSMLRPLLFVPPSMPIGVLLNKMQSERRHMALVIDEYGGVDGLVTIEDLIEQVVGQIEDEHDSADSAQWAREKQGCYLVQAKASVEEFGTAVGLDFTEDHTISEDIDTVGGLLFMLAGSVPVRGEVIVHPNGTEFEILEADPRRVQRARVRLPGHALAGE